MLRTLVQEGCFAIPEVFPFLARVLREREEGGDFVECSSFLGCQRKFSEDISPQAFDDAQIGTMARLVAAALPDHQSRQRSLTLFLPLPFLSHNASASSSSSCYRGCVW